MRFRSDENVRLHFRLAVVGEVAGVEGFSDGLDDGLALRSRRALFRDRFGGFDVQEDDRADFLLGFEAIEP